MEKRPYTIGEYSNGNYSVKLLSDGTKIRETFDENAKEFISEFPESMDVKITNQCDMGCPFCHENSTALGKHGDIIRDEFISSIHPFTEVAIGGGNPLEHPDLIEFLHRLKRRNVIANMTVNQNHLIKDEDRDRLVRRLVGEELIHGVGISLTNAGDPKLHEFLKDTPNAVLHVIAGIVSKTDFMKLSYRNIKLLILGYKHVRRGESYFNQYPKDIQSKIEYLKRNLRMMYSMFDVVSFDNLAIKQLDVKNSLQKSDWDKFYMGDDGQHTMYIDLVENVYAPSSTSKNRVPIPYSQHVVDMFENVKKISATAAHEAHNRPQPISTGCF